MRAIKGCAGFPSLEAKARDGPLLAIGQLLPRFSKPLSNWFVAEMEAARLALIFQLASPSLVLAPANALAERDGRLNQVINRALGTQAFGTCLNV